MSIRPNFYQVNKANNSINNSYLKVKCITLMLERLSSQFAADFASSLDLLQVPRFFFLSIEFNPKSNTKSVQNHFWSRVTGVEVPATEVSYH